MKGRRKREREREGERHIVYHEPQLRLEIELARQICALDRESNPLVHRLTLTTFHFYCHFYLLGPICVAV